MSKITYIRKRFREEALGIIGQANTIIDEYAAQGFDLTIRQLFYQFVARGFLANSQENYKKLGTIVSDARLAGMIDWNRIEDRTRGVERISTWDSPADIVSVCANTFKLDKWETQPYRVEIWIEKEALAGVFERVCAELRVPYLSCRGYTSQSEMWRAGQRLLGYVKNKQTPLILHFGDHDPSGIDMSRDIVDRLKIFTGSKIKFNRLALNMDQVEEHSPPPNPTKMTDTRANVYIEQFGDESWELDALDPTMLSSLCRDAVQAIINQDAWDEMTEREEAAKRQLESVSDQWDSIVESLE